MDNDPLATEPAAAPRYQHWTTSLLLFGITSVVETLGVSQIFAFMPLYLGEMGLPAESIPQWVGVMNSLVFVLGLPLVPLWGVWADKYSRKAIIVRSALVEAAVFGLMALSREPWQLAGSLMLVGFQLGNTGVMLASLRDVTPKRRLGTAIALFGASSPIGFAVGPAIGGIMIDRIHTPIWAVYAVSSALSLGTALMLIFGWKEVRPRVPPAGPVLRLAYGAMRGVLTDRMTRRLFIIFGMSLLARHMASPFMPILVQGLNPSEIGLASAVALVVGTAALIGGLISPMTGALGDRIGFRRVLTGAMAGAAVTLALMPFEPNVPWLAVNNVAYAALNASITAMVFGLLASEIPSERSSATLNLVYLPLYIAGIIGPAIGAVLVTRGLPLAFEVAGLLLAIGALFVVTRLRHSHTAA